MLVLVFRRNPIAEEEVAITALERLLTMLPVTFLTELWPQKGQDVGSMAFASSMCHGTRRTVWLGKRQYSLR